MTDKDKSKPVTLADYIPPAPAPAPRTKRRTASQRDRERLDALDRELRDEDFKEPKRKGRESGKKKSNLWTIAFYCIVLVVILKVLD